MGLYELPRSRLSAIVQDVAQTACAPGGGPSSEEDSWESLCNALGVSPHVSNCQAISEVSEDASLERATLCQDGSLNLEEEVGADQAEIVACRLLSPLQTPSPIYDWLTLVSCSKPRYLSRL